MPYTVLGENDEYVYVVYLTGDFNCDAEDEEKMRIFREMREDLYHIGFEVL